MFCTDPPAATFPQFGSSPTVNEYPVAHAACGGVGLYVGTEVGERDRGAAVEGARDGSVVGVRVGGSVGVGVGTLLGSTDGTGVGRLVGATDALASHVQLEPDTFGVPPLEQMFVQVPHWQLFWHCSAGAAHLHTPLVVVGFQP